MNEENQYKNIRTLKRNTSYHPVVDYFPITASPVVLGWVFLNVTMPENLNLYNEQNMRGTNSGVFQSSSYPFLCFCGDDGGRLCDVYFHGGGVCGCLCGAGHNNGRGYIRLRRGRDYLDLQRRRRRGSNRDGGLANRASSARFGLEWWWGNRMHHLLEAWRRRRVLHLLQGWRLAG